MDIYALRERVLAQNPLVHHITNWVTIYDCAAVVKSFGASPVMAHARDEVADMAGIANALVLNIGTLTRNTVDSMILAGREANRREIPVVLDVCGAGATVFRNEECERILSKVRVNILKGNASEVASIAGEQVKTRGVDAGEVSADLRSIAKKLAAKRECTVVITGKSDIVVDHYGALYMVANGHEMMRHVVGTGCMAASVIGTFTAVEKEYAFAAAAGLSMFEIAAENAAENAAGPGTFKQLLLDKIFTLSREEVEKRQRISG
jgi:hydroxyethylthiazole kinase